MILDENNLKKYVINKNFKKYLLEKYFANEKLIDALDEYILYSKNKILNNDFYIEKFKIENINNNINHMLDLIK